MSSYVRTLRRKRRWRKTGITAAALSTVLTPTIVLHPATLGSQRASAYPEDPNDCELSDIEWAFNADSPVPWTFSKQSWVLLAMQTLNTPLDYDGTQLLEVTSISYQDATLEDAFVELRDEEEIDYGSAHCPGGALDPPTIWLNSNYSTQQFYSHVARHEMMHLAGAEHGGNIDSFDGNNPPAMATCVDDSTFPNPPTGTVQDDAAYLNYIHSSREDRQLHANWGWEQGTNYWGLTAGTFSYQTSGGSLGPGFVAWQSPSSSDYVYQTVALQTGDDDESYQAVAAAKASSADYKTVANPALYRRTISHDEPDNSCDYPDGVDNPNDYETTTGWVLSSEVGMTEVGTDWVGLESEWENPPTNDGYEIQLRVYGSATHRTTGELGAVHLDNTRGDGT